MAQKDLTSKILESEPDVFADIFNTLLFLSDETKIDEENLVDEPTEGFFRDNYGNNRNMFQDIAKSYTIDNMKSYLACFNIENESVVKRNVPLKCLGYKYTTLKRQHEQYENKRKALLELLKEAKENRVEYKAFENELKKLGKFQTVPFISIVLNFDNKEWDEPTNLADLNIDSVYSQFDESFNIRVFNVKSFDEEMRSKFKSDFRIFLEMFCTNTLPDELKSVSLRHPTELIDMIIAFSGNESIRSIRNNIAIDELKGMNVDMNKIFDDIAKEAAKEATIQETINSAKVYYGKGVADNILIEGISERLEISIEEATEIFEKEVLMIERV